MTRLPTDGRSSGNAPLPVPPLSLDAKVAFLSQPHAYPDHPARVQPLQTHMAWVFLTDQHAWKLKKPVRYDFLDFSTIAARHADSQREFRLNRRLAPGVYLDVVPLRLNAEQRLSLAGGDGEVVDWLVQMRRLPAQCMLDQRIKTGTVEPRRVRQLADLLADFYTREPPLEILPEEYRRRFERDIRGDRRALLEPRFHLSGETVNAAVEGLLHTLREQPSMFDLRVHQQRIVEAHGDLRPQHVCMIDPAPVVIDCLEFNADFRQLDPVDELAFLALECERLGAAWVGQRVLEVYCDIANDHPPAALVNFYTRRRALLRGKLAVWHTADHSIDHHEEWRQKAEEYLARAVPEN